MTREPEGDATGLLDGFAAWLAQCLLKEAARHDMQPEPDTDIARERRVRMLAVMARTALAIRKLEEREALRKPSGNPEEADMDDQPDDEAAIERKYVQLHARLAEYAARIGFGRDQEAGAARSPGSGAEQLADQGQQRAT